MVSRVSMFKRASAFVLFIALLGAADVSPVAAGPVVRIAANTGGRIGDFVLRLRQYRAQGSLVQFSGNCDSACTLLLALPRGNACITSDAAFRFHAPSAASAQTSFAAKQYMLSQYPGWVRSWISRNNGLTSKLIVMDYAYASRFMRNCDTVAMR